MNEINLDQSINKVENFPKPGILFYDVTGILMDPPAFDYCIKKMEDIYRDETIDAVVAIESRGFLFAAPFAQAKKIPIILARKKGKLPGETVSKKFTLEYGEDEIEIHKADIASCKRVLIVDDLIATGGTIKAVADLFEENGVEVAGLFSVIGLPFLNYDKVIGNYKITTLIDYNSESMEN